MTRVARFACFAAAAALLLAACGASGKKEADEPKGSMTVKTVKKLQKVRELAEKKDWDGALAELDEISQSEYLNDYEKAKLWEARAGVHLGKNGGVPSDEVASDLEQALALDAMGKEERLAATYNLAQGYFMLERFSESADTFAKWANEAENRTPEQNYVIASAFFQAKRYEEALPYAQKAVDGSDKPSEPWLRLVVAIHYELKQEAEAATALARLVKAYPKKQNALELAQAYADAGEHDKAVATLEPLYAKGQLTDGKEVAALANLYQRAGKPLKGAELLDKGMRDGKIEKSAENLETLALCYVAGKEADKAQAALRAAGEEAGSGEVYFQLALLQGERGQWTSARDAVAQAIQKGGLSSPGDAQLLLGISHYNTKRKDAALASLTEAKRYGPTTAKCADEWIKIVKSGKAGAKADCRASGAAGGSARASAASK